MHYSRMKVGSRRTMLKSVASLSVDSVALIMVPYLNNYCLTVFNVMKEIPDKSDQGGKKKGCES